MRTGQFALLSTAFPAVLLLGFTSSASALTYFGEDINSTATGSQENAQRIAHPNADAARNAFLANLITADTATNNCEGLGSTTSQLLFEDDVASLSTTLGVLNLASGTTNGLYPISGNKALLPAAGVAQMFTLTFDEPQMAFGLYVTDIEVPGNLTLKFQLANAPEIVSYQLPTRANANGANNTGSVVYFGVVDDEHPFSSVTFTRNYNNNDGFAFDDLTVSKVPVVDLPEPATVGLLCLGVMGLIGRRGKQ